MATSLIAPTLSTRVCPEGHGICSRFVCTDTQGTAASGSEEHPPPPSQLHGGHSMKYSAGTLVVLRLPECVQGWESGVHSDEGVHSHGGCFLAFTPFTAELLENVIV